MHSTCLYIADQPGLLFDQVSVHEFALTCVSQVFVQAFSSWTWVPGMLVAAMSHHMICQIPPCKSTGPALLGPGLTLIVALQGFYRLQGSAGSSASASPPLGSLMPTRFFLPPAMGPPKPGIHVGYATWRCVCARTHHHPTIHVLLAAFSCCKQHILDMSRAVLQLHGIKSRQQHKTM